MASRPDSRGGTARSSDLRYVDVVYHLPQADGRPVPFPRVDGKDAFLEEAKALAPAVVVVQHPNPSVELTYYAVRVNVANEDAAVDLVLGLAERAWKWADDGGPPNVE